jgi:hypothetical protein
MLLLAQGSRWRRRRRPAARGGQSHGSNRTAAASGNGGLPLGDARRYIDATRDFRLPRAEGETDLSGGCADYAGWPRDADEREGGGATSAAAAATATSCDEWEWWSPAAAAHAASRGGAHGGGGGGPFCALRDDLDSGAARELLDGRLVSCGPLRGSAVTLSSHVSKQEAARRRRTRDFWCCFKKK